MTLRYLEVFLALARTPNMRDVAAQLFISQAAVSSALRDFEAELKAPLFDRVGRGIRLNDRGRLLEARLAPLFNQLRDRLALMEDDMAGRLYIGASTTLSDCVLPQVLYDFRVRHGQAEIECETGNTADIVRKVEKGVLDMGFVEGEVQSLAVRTVPMARESLVTVTSDRALASAPRPFESLLGYRWLLREPGSGTRETFLRQLSPRGLRPRIFLEFEHTEAIRRVLRNPGTLACLSPQVVREDVREGKLFVIEVPDLRFERTFYRVEHPDCPASPLREALAATVRERLMEQTGAQTGTQD